MNIAVFIRNDLSMNFVYSCGLLIFNQNNFSLLQKHQETFSPL